MVLTSTYSKGRLNISKDIRDKYNLLEGDILIAEVQDKKLIFKKAEVVEKK